MSSFDNKMSLYIPRCDTRSLPRHKPDDTNESYEQRAKTFIANQFRYQKIGNVERVDLVPKKTPDGYVYYIAFIHFSEWFDNSVAREFQDDVVDENTRAKLQFHEKWFWICNKNNKPLDAGEVDAAKKLWEQQQQIMQLQAQIAVMQQMGMMPMLQSFSHPYMPMGAAQLATQGFTSHPAEFPPLTTTAPALTRQTNMGGGCGCDDDSCKL